MGTAVIPLLLQEVEERHAHWYVALREITGADPIPEADAGVVPELSGAADHLCRRSGAGEKAEIRAGRQLDVLAWTRGDGLTQRDQLPRGVVARWRCERAIRGQRRARRRVDADPRTHRTSR